MNKNLTIVHTDRYNDWVFDPNHPTQGARFGNAAGLLDRARLRIPSADINFIEPDTTIATCLESVHHEEYVAAVRSGYSDEWAGQRKDLGELAELFVSGTLTALSELVHGRAHVAVNLPGAKHHAQFDHSSGFCVLADFAIAAKLVTDTGCRVAILDFDAHHGDGTENLTADNPLVRTISMHENGIFPGTGLAHDEERNVYNFPLSEYTGVRGAARAWQDMLALTKEFRPDFIFIAAGADAHETDPLSSLQFPVSLYRKFGQSLATAFPSTPILVGGAGGYQPDIWTPVVWTEFILGLATISHPKEA